METKQGLPIMSFASRHEWEAWLDEHHLTSKGLWLKIAKRGAGVASVTSAEALDIALCYGWIDGQRAALDDAFYLQKYTPRGPRSVWSKINREKALALIAAGRMRPAGLAAVEQARRTGRWDQAYDSPRTAAVPDDLHRALDENPAAAAFFTTLDSRNRYAILYRIQEARRPATRARRIAQAIAMLTRREKLYP